MTLFVRWRAGAMALAVGSALWSSATTAAPAPMSETAIETHRVAEADAPKYADGYVEDYGMGRWYAGLHAGAVINPDMEIRGSSLKMDAIQDVGYVFDAVLGYKFRFGLRLDGEFSYRNNDTNAVFFPATDTKIGDGIGGVEAMTAIINGWYDFDFVPASGSPFGNWSPYLGGGIGYAKVWIDPGHSGAVTVIDSSDSTIVWQAGAGFIYNYTRDVQISIDYRYLRSILDLDFRDLAFPGSNDAVYQTHSVMLGFRGFF